MEKIKRMIVGITNKLEKSEMTEEEKQQTLKISLEKIEAIKRGEEKDSV